LLDQHSVFHGRLTPEQSFFQVAVTDGNALTNDNCTANVLPSVRRTKSSAGCRKQERTFYMQAPLV
jgi:hypothetical protein